MRIVPILITSLAVGASAQAAWAHDQAASQTSHGPGISVSSEVSSSCISQQTEASDDVEAASADAWTTVAHCQGVCAALAAMGCAGVGYVCSTVTVITIGGVAVPCLSAVLIACGASAYGAAFCLNLCAS